MTNKTPVRDFSAETRRSRARLLGDCDQPENAISFLRSVDKNPSEVSTETASTNGETEMRLRSIIEATEGYSIHFDHVCTSMENVENVFALLARVKREPIACYDTDVILGAVFNQLGNWAIGLGQRNSKSNLEYSLFPDLASVVGPRVLSYLVDSSQAVYFPSGTIAELDSTLARLTRIQSRLRSEIGNLVTTRSKVPNLASELAAKSGERLVRDLAANLKRLETVSNNHALVSEIQRKAKPLREQKNILLDPQMFDRALAELSNDRKGVPLNNVCDAWNFAEVASETFWHKGADLFPILITTTKTVRRLADSTFVREAVGIGNSSLPIVDPFEFFLFSEIVARSSEFAGTDSLYNRCREKAVDFLAKANAIRKHINRVAKECRLLMESPSMKRDIRTIAIREIFYLFERIHLEHAALSEEHGWSFATEFVKRSSSDWLYASMLLPPFLEEWAKKSENPEVIDYIKKQLHTRLDAYFYALDFRSDMTSLVHVFGELNRSPNDSSLRVPNYIGVNKPERPQQLESPFRWYLIEDCSNVDGERPFKYSRIKDLASSVCPNDLGSVVGITCRIKDEDAANPLFVIYLRDESEMGISRRVIDLRFFPNLAPKELWEIESELFVRQHPAGLNSETLILERAFRGDWILEREHRGVTSERHEPLFSDWTEFEFDELPETRCQPSKPLAGTLKIQSEHFSTGRVGDISNIELDGVQYADVLTESLTFYVRTILSDSNEYHAGLVFSLPINRPIEAIAELLHRTNHLRLTKELYSTLINEGIQFAGRNVENNDRITF